MQLDFITTSVSAITVDLLVLCCGVSILRRWCLAPDTKLRVILYISDKWYTRFAICKSRYNIQAGANISSKWKYNKSEDY